MYDAFSEDYDRFVNWPGRLTFELPMIERLLQGQTAPDGGPARVLDAAGGTGQHVIALAQRGYRASGADLSGGMVARAHANAAEAGVDVRFEHAGFSRLAAHFGRGGFDAVLCLGNSLPHVLTLPELAATLRDFAALLRPGGLLLVQNRNFDAVMAGRQRWMEPQAQQEGDQEWLFVRFYDLLPNGMIDFNILALRRAGKGAWSQEVLTTRLRPLLQDELSKALAAAGFQRVEWFGGLDGAPYDSLSSGNLVAAAWV